ncbi:tRNA (uridine(34)/cytosine(34)/5-carboxymethylaminomethyluridine(34)-2'-O)-methyltransferase TrmL [Gehongia tenuis]|uniref:Putative tRNA (cytidine(34)-2'-O)-methyltransferase n=1 Tax=Gehongia tenuis TaxID=2763655 RepID=A0A926D4E4_9FIRM|nr:tRNA (uridine(34)/cytosine(34)/5-carboxymethylaminomethyluridine(34)-2'-O)-methyltransferase TrmL [Gehongia tenuis]
MHVVLVEPEIPQNTGNIARSCAATGTVLHLVHPLGFEISDKQVKRAGLDYWHLVEIHEHQSFAEVYEANSGHPFFFCSTKASKSYAEATFPDGSFLVFGKETKGLPEELLREHLSECIRIPMREGARSLNLGNSVAIVLYEALRQHDFAHLMKAGKLAAEFK